MESAINYLARLKDRIYFLLILKEREVGGEDVHFAEHATQMAQRMVGALSRYPVLKNYDGFDDAINAVSFCAQNDISLQYVRTHILNSINDVDRLIGMLEDAV